MKTFRITRAHSAKCRFRDDRKYKPWYFDTWTGLHHESRRGSKRFVYAHCNCPGCPALLRVSVDALENFVAEQVAVP